MPSRHRLEKKLAHDVDVIGIAAALAVLVSVGVLTGGDDNRSVSEDRPSSSASMQIAPTLTMEKTETLSHADVDFGLSGTSPGHNGSR